VNTAKYTQPDSNILKTTVMLLLKVPKMHFPTISNTLSRLHDFMTQCGERVSKILPKSAVNIQFKVPIVVDD